MRISDWSSDVCSSDLPKVRDAKLGLIDQNPVIHLRAPTNAMRHGWRAGSFRASPKWEHPVFPGQLEISGRSAQRGFLSRQADRLPSRRRRSEEHTSELQSLMRISYAVFCLKKQKL